MRPSVPTWNAGRPRPEPACSSRNWDPQSPQRRAVADLPSIDERGCTRGVEPETPACDRLPTGRSDPPPHTYTWEDRFGRSKNPGR